MQARMQSGDDKYVTGRYHYPRVRLMPVGLLIFTALLHIWLRVLNQDHLTSKVRRAEPNQTAYFSNA